MTLAEVIHTALVLNCADIASDPGGDGDLLVIRADVMVPAMVNALEVAGLVVVCADDLRMIFTGSMHHPKVKRAAIARLWGAAFPSGKPFEAVLDEIEADQTHPLPEDPAPT